MKIIFLAVSLFFSLSALAVDDWKAQEMKLKALTAKVNSKKEEVDKIIEEEKATTDKESLRTLMDNLSKAHKTLLEKDQELRELKNYVRFHYPGHGLEVEKKYTPLRAADMYKYEAEVGIDGKLNRVKQRVHEIYGKDAPAPKVSPEPAGDADQDGQSKASPMPAPAKVAAPLLNKSIITKDPERERIKLTQ